MSTIILFLLSLILPSEAAPVPASQPAPEPAPRRQIIHMTVTAYCLRSRTATGTYGHIGTCAGPRHLLGRRVKVAGWRYHVTDVHPGGGIDIWLPSRGECRAWGRRRLPVEIEVK